MRSSSSRNQTLIGLLILLATMQTIAGCSKSHQSTSPSDVQSSADEEAGYEVRPFPASLLPELQGRRFRFVYSAELINLPKDSTIRVWVPIASATAHQQVKVEKIEVPAEYRQRSEADFGNRLIYFEAQANSQGRIPIRIEYEVIRSEISEGNYAAFPSYGTGLGLRENRLVKLSGKAQKTLLAEPLQGTTRIDRAHEIFDRVLDHMRYEKPVGGDWGRGDSEWACESGYGNCTDFHSLFIALCRTEGIPAQFQIGFSIPPENASVDGYHCWAVFADGDAWKPADLTEAKQNPERKEESFARLADNRMRFTVGRDLTLDPPQDGPALNFWIHPYAEVNGTPHEQFETNHQVVVLPSETQGTESGDGDVPTDDSMSEAPPNNDESKREDDPH